MSQLNSISKKLFKKALQSMPGGVNSPVRAFKSVGGEPCFITKGKGAYIYDADSNKYIDYVLSWGPLLLGHAPKEVVSELHTTALRGLSFGAPTEKETELAEEIKYFQPSMQMVRLVSSGTEALMSAIRLARGYTNRDKIIKFSGCYHGHADYLLVEAGSGSATLGMPNSPGVPRDMTKNTLIANFNDEKGVESLFKKYGNQIAAVCLEPIAGNMGVIPAKLHFIKMLRELCTKYKSLLIFDEVMSGFRVHSKGAEKVYNVKADIICLGKVVGGGMPIGVYGGSKKIMKMVAPEGPVYQAGTLSGNPVSVACGLVSLRKIRREKLIDEVIKKTKLLCDSFQEIIADKSLPITISQAGSMFTIFFTNRRPVNLDDVKRTDSEMFKKCFHFFLQNGIYFPPSLYEAAFLSSCHNVQDIKKTTHVFKQFIKKHYL